MYSRVNYTIVGIFVLLFGAGLVGFTFWLAKYSIKSEFNTYKLYMKESVSGLSKDSTVRFKGVDIGRVVKISINPNNIEEIEVYLKIRSEIPIKKDMIAHTKMLGITGLLSIEIDGGTNEAELLVGVNEDDIPVIKTSLSWFSKTTKGIGGLSENLSIVLDRAEKLLSEENINSISAILKNTNILTNNASNIMYEFNSTMQAYKKTALILNASIESASKDFNKISVSTMKKLEMFEKLTKDFNRLILSVEKSLNRGDYSIKETFEPMIIDIGIMTEQLTDLAREVENSPNGLLFKSRKSSRGPGE